MTIRGDLTVNWNVSPRIITVAAPSIEITIQDLLDTCRYLESQQSAMDDARLIDAAGKEFLGGTTYVGLTATLQNAVIAFEARLGPGWVLCAILGGNVVAVDTTKDPEDPDYYIDPRMPTAYVSVDRTASASATLQEQEALQYSSFGGGVTVNTTSPYTGTEYPVGTLQQPVNNIPDALLIADERGFEELHIIGDITLGSSVDISGFKIFGSSVDRTTITISSGVSTLNTGFEDCTLSGTLDGNHIHVKHCEIETLNNFNGHLIDCILSADILLAGSETAHLLDCRSGVAGMDTPTIDMGGSGRGLGVRAYAGGIKLINKNGNDKVSIDLISGQIKLADTVTNGEIVVRGVGILTDDSTGATVVVDSGLINPQNVADTTLDTELSIHTVSGTVGEAMDDTVNNARLIPAVL